MSETDEPADGADDDFGSPGLLGSVVPDFIRRNFALKFAIVLAIMALSVGLMGVLATDQIGQYTEDQVVEEYEGIAEQEASTIEQWIQRNELTLQFISARDTWDSDDPEFIASALERANGDLAADSAGVHLLERGPDGMLVVASSQSGVRAPVEGTPRAWTENQSFRRAGEVIHSSTYQTDAGPVIGFMSPVENSENRYVLVEYELWAVTTRLQDNTNGDGRFTQVVDSSNRIVIDQPRTEDRDVGERVTSTYSSDETALDTLSAARDLQNQTASVGFDGSVPGNSDVIDEEYVVSYSRVPGTDWVVLVHAPASNVFGFSQDVRNYGLIGTAVMVLLIGAVGAGLGYSTSTTIDRLTRKAEQMREGNLDVDIQTSRIDNLGRLYRGFADMRDSLKEQIEEAEQARKEAEVSRAEAIEVNRYLEEKAEEFSRAMEATAAGDMTQRMETDGENDAMDDIAEEFNSMMDELEKTVGQLKNFSDEVAESGEVVLSSSESVRDASEQVAESIQKISDEAYTQKERLQDVSESLDDLVETLEDFQKENPSVEVADAIEEFRSVAGTLQEAAATSEDMMAETETVAGAAEEQAAELNEVSSRADKLKRYARPLGDILNRFETEAEHEFVFSGGPSQSTKTIEENDD